MVNPDENPVYVTISDGEGDMGHDGSYRWRKVGLAGLLICVITLVATLLGSSTTVNSENVGLVEDASPKNMTFQVLPQFQGSTGQFSIEPGGLFSAELQTGSNSTGFLQDHRLQYIVEGEIYFTDGTGQSVHGKAGDVVYMPYGSNVTMYTPRYAKIYMVSVDKTPLISPSMPSAYLEWMYDSALATPISHYPNLKDRKDQRFQEYASKLSAGTTSAYFDELGCFKFQGQELPTGLRPSWVFCCGVFHLAAGPAFTSGVYKHHYEIDYLLSGSLRFREGNGQEHLLTTGDLVHNPRHLDVAIDTPTSGKFLTVSLSDVDDFWR